MGVEENKAIARRAFEALKAGDLSLLRDLLAPQAVLHQCGFLRPLPAMAISNGQLPGRGVLFPGGNRLDDRQVRLGQIIGEGDTVALHWWTSGRYRDPDSPEHDGKVIDVPSMTFIRLEDGKIVEIWNMRDTSTLESQLYEPAEPVGVE